MLHPSKFGAGNVIIYNMPGLSRYFNGLAPA